MATAHVVEPIRFLNCAILALPCKGIAGRTDVVGYLAVGSDRVRIRDYTALIGKKDSVAHFVEMVHPPLAARRFDAIEEFTIGNVYVVAQVVFTLTYDRQRRIAHGVIEDISLSCPRSCTRGDLAEAVIGIGSRVYRVGEGKQLRGKVPVISPVVLGCDSAHRIVGRSRQLPAGIVGELFGLVSQHRCYRQVAIGRSRLTRCVEGQLNGA